ncbi:MAG: biotin attachment protein, partial [Desulfovibrionaceae bacterium]
MMLLDISVLVEEIKKEPYEVITVYSKCSGKVFFGGLEEGTVVYPALGTWKEIPATELAVVEREKNKKPIFASKKAIVKKIHSDLEGHFIESGTE